MPLLQDRCEGLAPWGLHRSLRPWEEREDTVIALSMVNISHVTARLLNSLLLLLRKREARGSGGSVQTNITQTESERARQALCASVCTHNSGYMITFTKHGNIW